MADDRFDRIIDGRRLGDLRLYELGPLSIKLHAEAERYLRLSNASSEEQERERYRQLAEQTLTDAIVIDELTEHMLRGPIR
jgi:hypothetical protein